MAIFIGCTNKHLTGDKLNVELSCATDWPSLFTLYTIKAPCSIWMSSILVIMMQCLIAHYCKDGSDYA